MNIFKSHTLLIITLLATGGCIQQSPENTGLAHSVPNEDRGDLSIQYIPPQAPELQDVHDSLLNSRFYDQLIEDLNDQFSFPNDIEVIFDECDEENAFYDPEDIAITMCYELIDTYAELFYSEYASTFDNEVIYASHFTFLHELGHALVDQLQLPIITKEEDVVDAFAVHMLVNSQESEAVLAGIEQFDVDSAEEAQLEELPFWGEHSLSEQRFFSVACLVYGSDPDAYQDFVDDDLLPLERAEFCEDEYTLADSSWEVLLEPYLK